MPNSPKVVSGGSLSPRGDWRMPSDASSRADYEAAQATAGAARANLAALDAQIAQGRVTVDTARVNLGYTNIVAPITGQVLSVVTKQGQTVNAVQAAPPNDQP